MATKGIGKSAASKSAKAGGGGGSKSVNYGSDLVDQHKRLATGSKDVGFKKGGKACGRGR